MIYDITYCTADCLNAECPRNIYVNRLPEVVDNHLLSQMDLSMECPEFEPDYIPNEVEELDFND